MVAQATVASVNGVQSVSKLNGKAIKSKNQLRRLKAKEKKAAHANGDTVSLWFIHFKVEFLMSSCVLRAQLPKRIAKKYSKNDRIKRQSMFLRHWTYTAQISQHFPMCLLGSSCPRKIPPYVLSSFEVVFFSSVPLGKSCRDIKRRGYLFR